MFEVEVLVARDGFTLDVELTAGRETVAIVGPNGAGKTTLLLSLLGLVTPQQGQIRLGDRLLLDTMSGAAVPVQARHVGMVFQDRLLFPHRTALDNIAFGPRSAGVPRAQARAGAREWLDRVGLNHRAQARPGDLSVGEAQRVALARALASEPELLLLDEPLASLDVDARQGMRRLLREHLDSFDGPVLLVTHDPVEAATLADRLVVLEEGRVTHRGTIDEITRRPRSSWVARLVGMNLYRGHADGDRIELDDGGELALADPEQGRVFVTIPPTAVALYRSRPEGTPRNVWTGRVDDYDTFGNRVRVHLAGTPPVTAEITPAAAAELDLARGGEVYVSVKATEITTFPVQ